MDYNKIEDAVFKKAMEFFKDHATKFFGVTDRIVGAADTEIKNINITTNVTDYLFYLEDGNYLHFEFQTTQKKSDILRFLYYDASLVYNKGKKVKTIVIYSADIEDAITDITMGSISYKVDSFFMNSLDGDKIFQTLKDKVENSEKLIPEDIVNLSFLPLMKCSDEKSIRIQNSITLAENISDEDDKLQCLTLLYALFEKFGDSNSKNRFKEVFSMTEIGRMIREEGITEGIAKGEARGEVKGKAGILKKQLIRKFKSVPQTYFTKIDSLSNETIDIIAIEILDMKSLSDLDPYLQ